VNERKPRNKPSSIKRKSLRQMPPPQQLARVKRRSPRLRRRLKKKFCRPTLRRLLSERRRVRFKPTFPHLSAFEAD